MNTRWTLPAGVLVLAAVLAVACASDTVSTTGTVTSTATSAAATASPTSQATSPDDTNYVARVQTWLDTYAADVEKAFAEQGDPVTTWKEIARQLSSASAAADLAREAADSLRAIVPPTHWASAQDAYVEALDRIARNFDDLARGDVMSAMWGWPLSQFLVEARQTFTSEVLGLPATIDVAPTTTVPPTP
jgi:hypothetical protein